MLPAGLEQSRTGLRNPSLYSLASFVRIGYD
jgi:hypothetical protein